MRLKRLSETDFASVAATTRLSQTSIEMAYRVLVLGDQVAAVASDHGTSRQRVHMAINTIERKYFARNTGDGLVRCDELIPSAMGSDLERFSRAYSRSRSPARRRACVQAVIAVLQDATQVLAAARKQRNAGGSAAKAAGPANAIATPPSSADASPQPGEWFLLPYAGPERERLVRVVSLCTTTGQWRVSDADGRDRGRCVLYPSNRISDAAAKSILG